MNNHLYFAPQHPIAYRHVFGGCLEKYGVYAHFSNMTNSDFRYLTIQGDIFENESCVEVIPVSPRNAEFRAKEGLSHDQQLLIINALELQFGTTLKPYKPLCKREESADGTIFHEVDKNEIESDDQRFYKKILLSMLSQEYCPTEHDREIMRFRIAMDIINSSPEMLYPENCEALIKQTNEEWQAQRAAKSIADCPF
jgi:hypothetical protein